MTLRLHLGPRDKIKKRLHVAQFNGDELRHTFDTDDLTQRVWFAKAVQAKFQLPDDDVAAIPDRLIALADQEDRRAESSDVPLSTCNGVSLAEVEAKPIHWFWDQYIPRGALSLLDGDPNEGKSQIAVSIAARHSRGHTMPPNDFPGGSPGNVLILSAEDDVERTTKPRLAAQHADMRRIHHLRTVTTYAGEERILQIPLDVPAIEAFVIEKQIGFIVIDVLSAFIQEGYNLNSDGDMRRAITPLTSMLERTQLTALALRHMNKREGTRAMYRGGGSVAIVGAARAAFAVAPHPDDPTQKVFAAVKHNLGPKPPSLTYFIEPAGDVSRVVWGGQTDLSAADVLGSSGRQQESSGSKVDRAKCIIADILADGPRGSNEALQACIDAGLSERTYHQARKDLGVHSERVGFGKEGQWLLTMPANGRQHDDF